MPRTLRQCLIEQTIALQLDFLLTALAGLNPPGDALEVPDEMLAETRRVLADLRRVLGGTPLQVTEPTAAPVTRAALRRILRDALMTFAVYDESNRQATLSRVREARKNKRLQESSLNLSPRPFAHIK